MGKRRYMRHPTNRSQPDLPLKPPKYIFIQQRRFRIVQIKKALAIGNLAVEKIMKNKKMARKWYEKAKRNKNRAFDCVYAPTCPNQIRGPKHNLWRHLTWHLKNNQEKEEVDRTKKRKRYESSDEEPVKKGRTKKRPRVTVTSRRKSEQLRQKKRDAEKEEDFPGDLVARVRKRRRLMEKLNNTSVGSPKPTKKRAKSTEPGAVAALLRLHESSDGSFTETFGEPDTAESAPNHQAVVALHCVRDGREIQDWFEIDANGFPNPTQVCNRFGFASHKNIVYRHLEKKFLAARLQNGVHYLAEIQSN
eukprot:TRINITY_DN2633_c0_g1_i2.p1 TRINITY_DN2633_c0_g1~~TRINITY_DN2633_c0_g1_i2.p1  ORF type:complete len:305 (+),score=57.66 TRINITY_DN2633_c0_g1_i2:304-1218(+)